VGLNVIVKRREVVREGAVKGAVKGAVEGEEAGKRVKRVKRVVVGETGREGVVRRHPLI